MIIVSYHCVRERNNHYELQVRPEFYDPLQVPAGRQSSLQPKIPNWNIDKKIPDKNQYYTANRRASPVRTRNRNSGMHYIGTILYLWNEANLEYIDAAYLKILKWKSANLVSRV